MNPGSTFRVPAHIITRELDNEIVILDMEAGSYFGLDPIGSRMWSLFSSGKSLDEMCDEIVNEYDASKDEVLRDALALAEQLTNKRMLEIVG